VTIFWHNLWLSAGRPSSSVLNNIRLTCNGKYKHAIRTAYNSYEKKLTDEMYDHFVHKNIPEFWKCWNAKFRKNVNNHVNINGCTSDDGIANAFADHFAKVYYNSHVDCTVKDRYQCVRDKCKQVDDKRIGGCIDGVSVELIDKCIRDMKKGKACGPDDLSAEHLLYAHPYVVVHLNILFKAILLHGSIPDNFGAGVSVPLIKDKTGNVNDVNNYCIITLSPVISKGRFLDLLVNSSVSKPAVNCNSLVKFVGVSEQNLTGCQLTER